MRRELVLTAMVSAAIGAGLMLLATGGRPPAGIEGWMPVNAEVTAALTQDSADGKDAGAADRGGDSGSPAAGGTAALPGKPGEAGSGSSGVAGGSPAAMASPAGGNSDTGAGAGNGAEARTAGGGDSAETGRISINRAGLAELQEIPGIGEKKAQAILDYRNTHGAFSSINDLTQVKGIGDKMLEKMKPYIGL